MNDIDELFLATRPAPPDAALDLAAREVARQVSTHAPERRRLSRPALIGAVAALTLVPAGVATADYLGLGAHTGRQVAELHDGDRSEGLDGCASDFATVVTEYRPAGRQLPAGLTWKAVDTEVATNPFGDCATGGKYPQTEGSVRANYTFTLYEGWRWAFSRAADRADGTTMRRAADQMYSLATDPAMLRVVEDGKASGPYLSIAQAARRGEVSFVRTRMPLSEAALFRAVR